MQTATQFHRLVSISLLLTLGSCASNEIGQSQDVKQETIYQQYDITYDENDNKTELVAQFRFAGVNGTTLVLNKPSKFELDGIELKVDSNDFSGAFYKTEIPGNSSFGKHQLLFTDIDKKKFENGFTIEPFRLSNVPLVVNRQAAATIQFEAPPLQADDYVEIGSDNTDSSFTIRHLATDSGSSIIIPVEQLQRQKGATFSISAMLYRKVALGQQSKEGGHIKIIQLTKPVAVKIKE